MKNSPEISLLHSKIKAHVQNYYIFNCFKTYKQLMLKPTSIKIDFSRNQIINALIDN